MIPRLSVSAESLQRASTGARSLSFPVARAGSCYKRGNETRSRRGNLFNGTIKRHLVDLRGCVEAAQFPHELQRGVADLIFSCGRLKIEESFDVPTHIFTEGE
jgi:hypothetical protein